MDFSAISPVLDTKTEYVSRLKDLTERMFPAVCANSHRCWRSGSKGHKMADTTGASDDHPAAEDALRTGKNNRLLPALKQDVQCGLYRGLIEPQLAMGINPNLLTDSSRYQSHIRVKATGFPKGIDPNRIDISNPNFPNILLHKKFDPPPQKRQDQCYSIKSYKAKVETKTTAPDQGDRNDSRDSSQNDDLETFNPKIHDLANFARNNYILQDLQIKYYQLLQKITQNILDSNHPPFLKPGTLPFPHPLGPNIAFGSYGPFPFPLPQFPFPLSPGFTKAPQAKNAGPDNLPNFCRDSGIQTWQRASTDTGLFGRKVPPENHFSNFSKDWELGRSFQGHSSPKESQADQRPVAGKINCKSMKSHKCIYCGKLYSRKYGLKIHIRTHTGFKPLKCKVCGRPFGDPSNLNKHVRLHSEGDTPYRCDFCGKVLVRRRDLDRHIKSRHQPQNHLFQNDHDGGRFIEK